MINNTRVKSNIEVIKNIKNSENNNINSDLLNQYTGWGGLRDAIYTPDIYRELKKYLDEEEIKSIKDTTGNAYYTPNIIVKFMWQEALSYILNNDKLPIGDNKLELLEPACGIGVFIDNIPKLLKQHLIVDVVEIDKITANILSLKHNDIKITCAGFQDIHYGNKKYDIIISNPPYGKVKLYDRSHKDLSNLCIHHYFIAKSARLLKDNGLMVMLMPSYVLDNIKDHARDFVYDAKVNLVKAYRLPDNMFINAKVTTDIMLLSKTEKQIEWLNTKPITIDNYKLNINEYFMNNKSKIFGKLEAVKMYERMGLTCTADGKLSNYLINNLYQ